MTKRSFLITLAVTAIFAACKKDDSTNPPKTITDPAPVSIIGKWAYLKDSINFYNNGKLSSKQVENHTDEYMQFNQDGTGKNNETSFTYKVDGKTLSLNFAAYSAGGVQHSADQETASILELSAHKLYIYYDFVATGNNSVYSTLSR